MTHGEKVFVTTLARLVDNADLVVEGEIARMTPTRSDEDGLIALTLDGQSLRGGPYKPKIRVVTDDRLPRTEAGAAGIFFLTTTRRTTDPLGPSADQEPQWRLLEGRAGALVTSGEEGDALRAYVRRLLDPDADRVDVALDAARSPLQRLRMEAPHDLRRMRDAATRVGPADAEHLLTLAADPDLPVRERGLILGLLAGMKSIGPSLQRHLRELLADDTTPTNLLIVAIPLAAATNTPDLGRPVLSLIDSGDPRVARQAIAAAGRLGSRELLLRVEQVASDDDSPTLRAVARQILSMLRRRERAEVGHQT